MKEVSHKRIFLESHATLLEYFFLIFDKFELLSRRISTSLQGVMPDCCFSEISEKSVDIFERFCYKIAENMFEKMDALNHSGGYRRSEAS